MRGPNWQSVKRNNCESAYKTQAEQQALSQQSRNDRKKSFALHMFSLFLYVSSSYVGRLSAVVSAGISHK